MAEEKEVIVTDGGGGGSGALIAVVLLIIMLAVGAYLFFGTNLFHGANSTLNINVKS